MLYLSSVVVLHTLCIASQIHGYITPWNKQLQYLELNPDRSYYSKDKLEANFSHGQIHDIGCAFQGSSFSKIYLDHNRIRILDRNGFLNSKSLNVLILSHNQLGGLLIKAFDGLTSLSELRLDNNNLDMVFKDWFKDLRYLHDLYLSHNIIFNIETSAFENLGNLINLDLSYNKLRDIDGHFHENAIYITMLDLSHNKFKSMNMDFLLKQTYLEELYLGNNRLRVFNSSLIRDTPYLRVLDLSQNPLDSIDITSLTKHNALRELYLSNVNNGLNTLPRFDGGSLDLRILDLSSNKLIDSDNRWIRVRAVSKIMNLSNNLFSEMPSYVAALGGSAKLDLSNNDFTSIQVDDMIQADELIIHDGFRGTVYFSCVLNAFPLTRRMFVSSTKEYSFGSYFMSYGCSYKSESSELEELIARHIDLENINFIKELSFGKLKKIDVAHNAIRFIPANITRYLPALIDLDVSHNEIKQCDTSALTATLSKLNLFGNPVTTFRYVDFVSFDINEYLANPFRNSEPALGYVDFSSFNVNEDIAVITDAKRSDALKEFRGTHSALWILVNNKIKCLCNISLDECRISKLVASHGKIASTEGLKLTGATDIDLSYNKLKSFVYQIDGGDNADQHTLQHLNLEGNGLMHLHFSSIAKSLIYLNAKKNNLETINLASLPSLKVLNAMNNRIKQLDITDMTSILAVSLDRNFIDSISIKNSSKLRILTLDGNLIKDCNKLNIRDALQAPLTLSLGYKEMQGCHNLYKGVQTLEVKSHQMSTLKPLFETRSKSSSWLLASPTLLRSLRLMNGALSSIHKNAFENCQKLEQLFLDFNQLQHLEWSIFASLHKLRILSLKGNYLESIGAEIVNQLPALRILDISDNSLKGLELPIEIYQKLTPASLLANPLGEANVVFDEHFSEGKPKDELLAFDSTRWGHPVTIRTYTRNEYVTESESCVAIRNVVSLASITERSGLLHLPGKVPRSQWLNCFRQRY